MRSLRLLVCAAALSLWFGRIAAQSTADTVYHLHGTVINAATGRPVGRALVTSRDRRLATMTNTEGQFSLDVSVPAASADQGQGSAAIQGSVLGRNESEAFGGASLALAAQRPGFLPSRGSATVSLNEAAVTRDIVLRLLPSASIHGKVNVNGTEDGSGVRVQLLRHAALNGHLVWQMASSRPVSADGTFTMTGLQPGEYTLATGEWSPPGSQNGATEAVTKQYPPDFLGDTRTLEGATRLHLRYGETAEAALHLRAVPYYSVSIPVQGLPPNSGANVRVTAGTGFPLYQLGWDSRINAVDGALPDGDYTVVVSAPGTQHAVAQIPLHIAGAPVVHAPAGLVPTEDIPVLVRDERTEPGNRAATTLSLNDGSPTSIKTPGFFLSVRPQDPEDGGGGLMQVTANGGPMLPNLAPGRYFLQGGALGNGYIASITSDGADLLRGSFAVNESGHTAPVEVTLRDDGGAVAGTVDFRNSGVNGARVLLLPADGSGHVVFAFANSAGTFQASNVPPGSYRAFATAADQPDTLPYLDAEAMRPYQGKGSIVSVSAGQTVQAQAELIGLDGGDLQP